MMKENEHVAETQDWTRGFQIFNRLTLSQLSYFGWFVVNFEDENAPFIETANPNKR